MVTSLNQTFKRTGRAISLALCLSWICCASVAQELPDPTRPPLKLLQSTGVEVVAQGPVLQSILVSANRKMAMIDGEIVKLNGKIAGHTLVKITESEVVLRQGRHYQTLKLHPDFEKKSSLKPRKNEALPAKR